MAAAVTTFGSSFPAPVIRPEPNSKVLAELGL